MLSYVIFVLESIINEAFNETGLSGATVPEENNFEGSLSDGWGGDRHSYNLKQADKIAKSLHGWQ